MKFIQHWIMLTLAILIIAELAHIYYVWWEMPLVAGIGLLLGRYFS